MHIATAFFRPVPLLMVACMAGGSVWASIRSVDLRCEGSVSPAGVEAERPVLSWRLAGDGRGLSQKAYRVIAASEPDALERGEGDLWDSGRVESTANSAEYAGMPLSQSSKIFWKVCLWDKNDEPSAWSASASWTMGTNSAQWRASKWIAAKGASESLLLRREFSVKPGLRRAVAHLSGLGHFFFYLNGKRVGDEYFAPGWTDYDKTVEYRTVEVTEFLKEGPNAVGFLLGNGFYSVVHRDRFSKLKRVFGPLCAILYLNIEYNDGTRESVRTDASWRTHPGPITAGNIYAGEDFDARAWPTDWSLPGFDAGAWTRAVELRRGPGALSGHAFAGEPVRAVAVRVPVRAQTFADGTVVYDFGTNASHVLRLRVVGPKGSVVRLTPAENVNADGTINRASMDSRYRGNAWWQYTKGTHSAETYESFFYFVGCRYVKAEAFRNEDELPARVGPEDMKSPGKSATATRPGDATLLPKIEKVELVEVHADMPKAGEIETSDPLLNRILALVRQAKRSNMMSVVMDCNAREKLGWIEAAALTAPSVRYEDDASRIYAKTVRDISQTQTPDGRVACIAPEYTVFDRFYSAPEWGAAFLSLSWQQYRFNGDDSLIRAYYPQMKKYVDWLLSHLDKGVPTVGANAGDWGDVDVNDYNRSGSSRNTPGNLTGAAFVYQDAVLLSQMAALLGNAADAQLYAETAKTLKAQYRSNFLNRETGAYGTGSQAANAITLVMGLCEPQERGHLSDLIVADVEKNAYMGTAGNIGYSFVLNALAQTGRNDVILKMLRQDERPGYAYVLKRGATAMTETWNANPTSALNHIMLTHVTEWFYRHLAGIDADETAPGFGRVVLKPYLGSESPDWVRSSYDSVRGKISVSWKKSDGRAQYAVELPPNVEGTLYLPAADPACVREAGKPVAEAQGVRFLGSEDGWCLYALGSGKYDFEFSLSKLGRAP